MGRRIRGVRSGGWTNGAVATSLHMTEGGVEKHITSIFAKLALPDSADDHRRVLAVLAFLNA
jgi:DNA-binding NarL/FixJ family response regulator